MSVNTKSCPYCGYVLSSSYTVDSDKKIFGYAMTECPRCHNKFLESNKYEWVNLSRDEKVSVLAKGPDYTICTLKEHQNNNKTNIFLVPLFGLGAIGLKNNNDAIKKIENCDLNTDINSIKFISDSLKRTENLDYLIALINSGKKLYGKEIEAKEITIFEYNSKFVKSQVLFDECKIPSREIKLFENYIQYFRYGVFSKKIKEERIIQL